MPIWKGIFMCLILSAGRCQIYARDASEKKVRCKDSLVKVVAPYVGLFHQHHDFFNKAFSYQGIDAGITFNGKLSTGIYGSMFVSPLKIELQGKSAYLAIKQVGISVGFVNTMSRRLYIGCNLNTGLFTLRAGSRRSSVLRDEQADIRIRGLVVSPHVFSEISLMKWMKVRIGLSYNIYRFDNQNIITRNDLQNVAFNFGIIFHHLIKSEHSEICCR
jgi:hypothetical protein